MTVTSAQRLKVLPVHLTIAQNSTALYKIAPEWSEIEYVNIHLFNTHIYIIFLVNANALQ